MFPSPPAKEDDRAHADSGGFHRGDGRAEGLIGPALAVKGADVQVAGLDADAHAHQATGAQSLPVRGRSKLVEESGGGGARDSWRWGGVSRRFRDSPRSWKRVGAGPP